jgi:hypothetical protein
MVSKCANPACNTTLHYLREGKVYVLEVPQFTPAPGLKRPVRRVEHFWLCGGCAARLTLALDSGKVVTLPRRAAVSPTAS